jgi:hypothetical protein
MRQNLCKETPGSKCGAGYQPAAALWAALVFNTTILLEAGCQLIARPHEPLAPISGNFHTDSSVCGYFHARTNPKLTHGACRV